MQNLEKQLYESSGENQLHDRFDRGNQFSAEYIDPNLKTTTYITTHPAQIQNNLKFTTMNLNYLENPYTDYYGYPREKDDHNQIPYWQDENTFVDQMPNGPQLLVDNSPDQIQITKKHIINNIQFENNRDYSTLHLGLFLIFIFFITKK